MQISPTLRIKSPNNTDLFISVSILTSLLLLRTILTYLFEKCQVDGTKDGCHTIGGIVKPYKTKVLPTIFFCKCLYQVYGMTTFCQSICRCLDLVSSIDFSLLYISLGVHFFVITSLYDIQESVLFSPFVTDINLQNTTLSNNMYPIF